MVGDGYAHGSSPVERGRVTTPQRRRWLAAVVVIPVVVAVVAVLVWDSPEAPSDQVVDRADRSPSSAPRTSPNHTIGDVSGVAVEVSPRTELLDGDLVEVGVEGRVNLQGAVILQCAGDVSADDVIDSCASYAVEHPEWDPPMFVRAAAQQAVSVARTIYISRGSDDPNGLRPYDCATEPSGCVLAVGPYEWPLRAVLVPLAFQDVPAEPPTAAIGPSADLQDGQVVTLTAAGLRPNATFQAGICEADRGDHCDAAVVWPSATSDSTGSLTTTIVIHAAIYGYHGRTDCVAVACAVVVSNPADVPVAEVPVSFAEGVKAPTPQLGVDPPGPYSHLQAVTVHGSGLRPGLAVDGHIAQCPADGGHIFNSLCVRPLIDGPMVDASGQFEATVYLWGHGPCRTGSGCTLAWVLPDGPTAASVPIEFRE